MASRNRAGSYFRTKVTPVNPRTTYQQAIRSRLTLISQAWKSLTDEQRKAWNSAVGDYSKTDIFGDLRNPTGFNLYQRLNNNLLIISESMITAPPVPQSVYGVKTASLSIVTGTPAMSLSFTDAIPATDKVKVFATPPLSQGITFVKSEYRLIDVLATADTSPVDIKSAYDDKFGAIPGNGVKVFVKLVPVRVATGQEGMGFVVSDISSTT